MTIDLREAARALDGALEGRASAALGVSTDSRAVAAHQLFVALRGERFDAHAFVAQAFAAGAAGALVERGRSVDLPADRALIRVDDTASGLARLGGWWRSRFALPLIAVTGSNGKTTVKEMIAAILRFAAGSDCAVLATTGNLNNQIGLPLTLLRLSSGHRYAVVEMGMNHPGEIAALTRLARPTVAVINNATAAHLEGLGTVADVARAKGEIFEGLDAGGTAVINADDEHAATWRALAGEREIVDFGLETGAAVTAAWRGDADGSELELDLRSRRVHTRLAVAGAHNVRNALAAAACASAAGIAPDAIAAGLASFQGVKGRQQHRAGIAGAVLIDDTYNANPASMGAAIDVLAARPGRRILAIADMRELGPEGARLHADIGCYARAAGIDALFATGELMASAVAAFGNAGRHFDDAEALAAALAPELDARTTVLIKGSRSMRMERVVTALAAEPVDGGGAH